MIVQALDRRTRPRDTPAQRSKFARVKNAQRAYERKLRKIARTIGDIVTGFAGPDPIASAPGIREALNRYSVIVGQWARSAGASMLVDVMKRDEAAWREVSRGMSRALADEIRTAPTGEVTRSLLEQQVELITSLPLEAARRVQALAIQSMETGARASEIAKEIMRSGEVASSRATLIAVTETSRASSNLLEARSLHVGSLGYIWRTSRDGDVRPLHRALEGVYIAWSDPPVAGSNGERAHAGCIYRCRCWAEPIIPGE